MKKFTTLICVLLALPLLSGCWGDDDDSSSSGSVACTIHYTNGTSSCYGGGSAGSCEQQTARSNVSYVSYHPGSCD